MKRHILTGILATLLATGIAVAADTPTAPNTGTAYGWQLMTPQERADVQARMRAATTWEEREQIRAEQHARMTERAKAQGVTLPDPTFCGPGKRGGRMGGRGMGMGGRW